LLLLWCQVQKRALAADDHKAKEWVLDLSFFAQRKKECEARELLDSDKVIARQFDLDWKRVAGKARFR
jgi:hypothetical protein